jgi:S-methylmethionine-dependent homocysteine/selenocysteine methylase
MGTELARRGVDTSGPAWSARAVEEAPEVIAAIHREYAEAGATVHTAATFRTQARVLPDRWRDLTRRAVELARSSVPAGHLVAGSMAPLADCYRPDLSPADTDPSGTRAEHAAMAETLLGAGCDRLLCETFTHAGEALLAAEAALDAARGSDAEVWLALSPGYRNNLLSSAEIASTAQGGAALGVGAVLVNCAPAADTLAHLRAIGAAVWGRGVAFGAYANAGTEAADWSAAAEERYLLAAEDWVRAGATLVGSCCGTRPSLTRALTVRLRAAP